MSDPERWLRDPDVSEEMRELLEAKAPPPTMPRETRLRVGSFVATMAAGTAAMSTALTGKVLAIAIAVSVAGTTAWVATRDSDDDRVGDSDGASSAPAHRSERGGGRGSNLSVPDEAPPPPIEPPVAPSPVEDERATSHGRAEPSHGRRLPSSSQRPPEVVLDPLAVEAAMLERARSLLAADPGGALAESEHHARVHPDGQLAEERELIAIDALRRLGRVPEAEARAHALIARHPNGMYARRARRLIGQP